MQTMYVKSGSRYRMATEAEVAEVAGHYAVEALNRTRPTLSTASGAAEFLKRIFAGRDYESFAVLFLNTHQQLIACVEMFRGTVDMAAVYPREVVKEVLWRGAANVILSHNHPSGVAEPSHADIQITERLIQALALIDVQVLDHLVIGGTGKWSSLKERGLL